MMKDLIFLKSPSQAMVIVLRLTLILSSSFIFPLNSDGLIIRGAEYVAALLTGTFLFCQALLFLV